MTFPLTICIMSKNEEDVIQACIQSAKVYADEIIVMDTGSTDHTVDLAKQSGADVKTMKWNNDFSEIRNQMIDSSQNPYILMLDADEVILPNQEKKFSEAIHRLKSAPNCIAQVVMISYMEDEEQSISCISRMFNNSPSIRYEGRIHEQIISSDLSLESFNSRIEVVHHGYVPERMENKNKFQRNIDLLTSAIKSDPNDTYMLFQLGRTYHVQRREQEAYRYLISAYRLSIAEGFIDSSLLITLGWNLLRLKKWSELLQLIDEGLKCYPNYTDLYYLYGCTLIELKNEQALSLIPDAFKTCIELGDVNPNEYESVRGVGSFRAMYNLGLFYELQGNYELAKQYYQKSFQHGFAPARKRLESMD